MRKLKLFVATLTILVGGLSSANAQEAGTYYIQNVSNGKWLGPGNNWGTQASVLNHADYWKLAKISDGVYTLESVVSNGGSNYYLTGTYCDGGSTNFTFAAVVGKDKTYTITSSGLLTTNGTTVDVSGSDATATASQWKLWSETDMAAGMAAATVANPFDATYLIKDHDLGRNNRDYSAWSNTGATEPKSTAGGGAAVFSVEAYCKTFDVNQTLTNVPNGVYAVRVNGFYRQDGSNANLPYVYANDSKTTLPVRTGTENNMQDAAVSFVAGKYLSEPAYVQVTDGTLKVGVKTEGTSCWTIFKNFHLAYYGNCTVAEVLLADYVKAYNEAIAEAQAFTEGSMFAEAWTALQSAISSNTLDLNNVTQEQLETATANLRAANTAATAAVKAKTCYDSAVTLINGGTNVDLTSIVVNASFEEGNLNGWTTVNGGAPANNNNWSKVGTWYVERWTSNGDTQNHLSDGTLTHDALVLPAGLYTITAKAQNQEQKNGVAGTGYFLYANDEKVEITGTNTYSTSVLLADKSELVIKFALEGCTGNWVSCDDVHLTYVGEDFPAYTLVTGKMNAEVAAAQATADETFQANKTIANYNALTAAITAAQASKDAYTKAATAIENAKELKSMHNFATTAAASTFAEAIAALETPYNNNTLTTDQGNGAGTTLGTVVTGWHAGAGSAAVAYMNDGFSLHDFDAALYINTWSTEGESDGSNFKVPFYEYFGSGSPLAKKTWTATLTGLENGLYLVSAWVRVQTTAENVADATGITMDVNGATATVTTDGTQVGETKFLLKECTAEGFVKDGNLNLNINILDGNNISWLSFKNIKYTKVRDLISPTGEDLENLNAAISVAEGKTLGFEAGEYAPYNNIAALTALKAAKAIDQSDPLLDQEVVQNATTALTSAIWTANAEEVNAIYDGFFTIQVVPASNTKPLGWNRKSATAENTDYEDNGYHTRIVTIPEGVTDSNIGMMTKEHAFYGDQEGYTMPLKAETYYTISFKHCGWNNSPTVHVNVYSEDGTKIATSPDFNTKNGGHTSENDGASKWEYYSYTFKTTTAGNYVIGLMKNTGATEQNQAGFTELLLKKTVAEVVNISENADYTPVASVFADVTLERTFSSINWNTFVVPFDIDNTTLATKFGTVEVAVYSESAEGGNSTVTFTTMSEPAITANVPVLLKTTIAPASVTFEGVQIKTGDAKVESTGNFDFVGSYAAKTFVATGDYYLKENKVYKSKQDEGSYIRGTRAYIKTKTPGARIINFVIDGEEVTGIEGLEVAGKNNGKLYNLAGQEVKNAQKGLYIQNGKKVIVK